MKNRLYHNIIIFILILLTKDCRGMKRGPHHPKSEMSSRSKTSNLDEHITGEEHSIDSDIKEQFGINVNPDDLSDDEKTFYYFKIHDNDNNNALDGLEMLHAAIHQENDKFTKLERDSYLQIASNELNHIIEVIDDFLTIADLNKDGYLHYPEYVKAITENKI